jgi:hypothetical protein
MSRHNHSLFAVSSFTLNAVSRPVPRVPIWVPSALCGIAFGVAVGAYTVAVSDETSVGTVVTGGIIGLLGGTIFGFVIARKFEQQRGPVEDAVADLPEDQRGVAVRSVEGGPAPADPDVRRAALRAAESKRDMITRTWRVNTVVSVVALAGFVFLAIASSPLWWVGTAAFAVWFPLHLTSRRRIEQRIALLSGEAPEARP